MPIVCPTCLTTDTRTIRTTAVKHHTEIRRRHECRRGHRFTTREMHAETVRWRVALEPMPGLVPVDPP